ncbi:ankyrin repeat domain-containing protein [Myxococcota bacterium]|nr:ankyrin repeat domain-containing protein [Myxococcota bacterium]
MVKTGLDGLRPFLVVVLFVLLQGCAAQSGLDSAIMSGIEPVSDAIIIEARTAGRLNSYDVHGETPLLKAVALQQVDNVRRLLALGADPDLTSELRNTPLGEVSNLSSPEIRLGVARALLNSGAEVDRKNSNGFTPLVLAAQMGHTNLIELLISHGAEVDLLNGYPPNRQAALLNAVWFGRVDAVKTLLDAGADPELTDHGQDTPLGTAAFLSGRIDEARLLLDVGADVDRKNSNGMAPLALAAQVGHSSVVELLISHGADVDMMNGLPPSETALLNAVIKGHLDVVRVLLDAGADPNFVHAPTRKRLTDWAREAKAWSVLAEIDKAIKRPPVRVARVAEPINEPLLTPVREPQYAKRPVTYSDKYTRRQALVIGNSMYKGISALQNATNDARAIRAALSAAGFEVIYRENASLRDMNEAVRTFSKEIQSADVSAFFYAGHAVQVDGQNYLLPVDVDIAEEYEISYEAFPLGRMLASLEKSDTSLNMVFLDACRNNPYSFSRSATRGIAMTRAPSATLVSYATAPDDVATDGVGRNSPYTKHLVDAIGRRGASLVDVIDLVQRGVRDETGGRQRPWVQYDVLPRDFVFVSE